MNFLEAKGRGAKLVRDFNPHLIAGDTGVHNLPRRPFTDHDMVCARTDNVKRTNVVARRNVIHDCDFRQNQPHISVGQRVDRAVITGNIFSGPAQIQNASTKVVQVGLNAAL